MKSSRQDGHAWYAWYPGDYQRDTSVQVCSFGARGLWREMLDMMHDAPVRGTLTVGDSNTNAMQITCKQLARKVGISEPECAEYLAELEQSGVFSRLENGTIYNRRMYREAIEKARLAEARSEAANARWNKQDESKPDANGDAKDMQNGPIAESEALLLTKQSPEAKSQNSEIKNQNANACMHRARDPKLPKPPDDLTPEEAARFTAIARDIRKRCPKARNRIIASMAMDDLQEWRKERVRIEPRAREPGKIQPTGVTELLSQGVEEIRNQMRAQ